VDFTGDGIADILSGCYWSTDDDAPGGNPQAGYFMILAGLGNMDFEEAKPITNSDGLPLLAVPLTKEQEETYDSNNLQWGNLCTSQHAVDYDGDGDLDLVTGCMHNLFYAIINSAQSPDIPPKFQSPGQELAIKSPNQHSDPHLYDWDGDGDLDLLTGGDSGGVYISMNEGSRADPQWGDFEELVKGHRRWEQTPADGEEPLPGHGARAINKRVAGISDKDFDKHQAKHAKKLEQFQRKMSEIQSKYIDRIREAVKNKDTEKSDKLSEEMQKEMEPFDMEYSKLDKEQRKFLESTETGHVWVYVQL